MASVDNTRDLVNSQDHFASTNSPAQPRGSSPSDAQAPTSASPPPQKQNRLAPAPMPKSNPWKRDTAVGRITPEAFAPVPQPGSAAAAKEIASKKPQKFGGPQSGTASTAPASNTNQNYRRNNDRNKRKQRRTPEPGAPPAASGASAGSPGATTEKGFEKRQPPRKKYYQNQHSSGSPFNMTLSLLVQQFEYYFSIENLCKDIYLRKQMNSKGFIPLQILADFNRVKILSNGDLSLVTEACNWCPSTEVVGSRVRLQNGWERWILPLGERDEPGTLNSDGEEDESPKFHIEKSVPFVPKRAA